MFYGVTHLTYFRYLLQGEMNLTLQVIILSSWLPGEHRKASSDADDFVAIPRNLPSYLTMGRYRLYLQSIYNYRLKSLNLGAYGVGVHVWGRCLSSQYINGDLVSSVNGAWRTIQLSICLHQNELNRSLTSSKWIFTDYNRTLDIWPTCQHLYIHLHVLIFIWSGPKSFPICLVLDNSKHLTGRSKLCFILQANEATTITSVYRTIADSVNSTASTKSSVMSLILMTSY